MPDGDQPARRGRPARKLPSCRGAPGHDRPDLANPQQERGAWSVHAEFPDGSFEEISGFKTENEANEWIAKDLQDWLDRRERSKSGDDQSPKG
jgi:hypothetical protein